MPASRRAPEGAAPRAGSAPRGAATRERLLRAAAEVVAQEGYGGASVAAIAARAGVATGALYRHFPSKAALFVELFREVAEHQLTAMREAARSGGFVERLDAVLTTYARAALAERRLNWALVYEPVDPVVDAERLAWRRRYRDEMAGLLRGGVAAGELPPQDVEVTAAAVVGALAEALVGPMSPLSSRRGADGELVRHAVAVCRRAVGVPDG